MTSEPTDHRVRADLYELAHLFGFWLEHPYLVEARSRHFGEELQPIALLFFGDRYMMQLAKIRSQQRSWETAWAMYEYELDDGDIFLWRIDVDRDGRWTYAEPVAQQWGIHHDGRLSTQIGNIMTGYLPATVDQLVEAGYERHLIDRYIREWATLGAGYVELFNEKTAEELKERYWRKFSGEE